MMMITPLKNIKSGFYNYIYDKHHTDSIHIKKIMYGLQIFKSEFSKLLVLMFLFFSLGKLYEFLFSLIILLPVRIYSGGLHMKTGLLCFLASFSLFFANIILLPKIEITLSVSYVLLGADLAIMALFSPVENTNKPINNYKKRRKCKILSVFFSLFSILIILMLLLLVNDKSLYFVGVWTLTLQALQVMLISLYSKRRKEK